MKKRKNLASLLLGIMLLFLSACGSEGTAGAQSEAQGTSGSEVIEPDLADRETGAAIWNTREETDRSDTEEDTNLEAAGTKLTKKKSPPALSKEAVEMQVHFIDVGQGDATLLMCGGEAMLIDAGDDSKGTAVQNYLKKQGVSRLKYLVLTHTDADHIGGSDVIISKFQVDNVFIGDFPKENRVYRNLMDALAYRGYPWSTPEVGSRYTLGTAEITILAPNRSYDDPNNCSIALLVENGEDSFLFTGDAEEEAEEDILANGLSVDCDVFKAGHHGSKTSNSTAFLEAVSPQKVVISCGEDNSYGHPHAGPLNTFRSMGAEVYRTDEQGSIVATSTGEEITWNTAPSDTWQAGEPKGTASSEAEGTASLGKQTLDSKITEQESVADTGKEAVVWKSATGEKYHSINHCGRMNPAKATQLTQEQAESAGLEPCSKCN